jgi:hypothetical protein
MRGLLPRALVMLPWLLCERALPDLCMDYLRLPFYPLEELFFVYTSLTASIRLL